MNLFTTKFTFFPILNNNHFTLIIVNIIDKLIYYYDPFGQNDEEIIRKFHQFVAAWNVATKDDFNIGNVITLSIEPKQKDQYNCGIFIIHVMRMFDKGDKFDPTFNPDEYREYLKLEVLQNSENMYNCCLYCVNENKDTNWVQCENCMRWVHVFCCKRECDWDKTMYVCELCECYNNSNN